MEPLEHLERLELIRCSVPMVPGVPIVPGCRSTELSPCELFGKRAGAVVLDDRAVLGVELAAVVEVFIHDRVDVLDMFGAEHMADLVDQCEDIGV